MNNHKPWRKDNYLVYVNYILRSYKHFYGDNLLDLYRNSDIEHEEAERLFYFQNPLIAHDIQDEPCLNYANFCALKLWAFNWDEMMGMPSHLTAPDSESNARNLILSHVDKHGAIPPAVKKAIFNT